MGANLISTTGAILDYDDNWTGRFLNTEVTLLTVTLNPTFAYRLNDWLSIGGGPQIVYANLDMKLKAPPPTGIGNVTINGDDVAFGYDVGTQGLKMICAEESIKTTKSSFLPSTPIGSFKICLV